MMTILELEALLPPDVTVRQLLPLTGLFTSNSDMVRVFEQGGIKLNREPISSLDEEIGINDFIGFIWIGHSFGQLLFSRGKKQHAIIEFDGKTFRKIA